MRKPIKLKKQPNPSIEYFKDRIKREAEIEKICREICIKEYQLDPDQLVCKMIPEMIGNLDRYQTAWKVPDKSFLIPAWYLFRQQVDIVWHHIALNGKAFK